MATDLAMTIMMMMVITKKYYLYDTITKKLNRPQQPSAKVTTSVFQVKGEKCPQ